MSAPSCVLKSYTITRDERERGIYDDGYRGRVPFKSMYPYEVSLEIMATAEFVSRLYDFFHAQGMDVPNMRPTRGELGQGRRALPSHEPREIEGVLEDPSPKPKRLK